MTATLDTVDLAPGSAAWMRLVTASKVPAILGVSPYDSPRSMWHKMRGDIPGQPETDTLRRGHYLEPAILAWWRDRHPEYRIFAPQYVAARDDLPWAMATLDGLASAYDQAPVVVEAKSSDKPDEWGRPGTDEVPPYYAGQVMFAMHLTGARRAFIPVLGTHLRFEEYVVDYDRELAEDIVTTCQAFYDSLTGDVPPDLDDHVATYEAVRAVNTGVDKGNTARIDTDLAAQWVDARAAEDDAVNQARLWDARIVDAVGTAQFIEAAGVVIGRQQVNRKRPIPLTTTLPKDTP